MKLIEWLGLRVRRQWLTRRVSMARDEWSPLRRPDSQRALTLLAKFIAEAEQIGETQTLHVCCAAAGLIHHQEGSFEESTVMLERALRLKEERSLMPILGLNYLRLRRYDDAIAVLTRATELDPGSSISYNALGVVYEEMGRYQNALLAYQHAIRLDPKDAAFHTNLGNAYRVLDRDDEALAAYQRAIELNPDYPPPHNNLAGLYVDKGRYAEATKELHERIRLKPDSVFLPYALLGIVERVQGLPESAEQFHRALAQWDIARQEYSSRPFIVLAAKAVALMCMGDTEEALKVLADAISKMLPGDKIDFAVYELLRTAPEPPKGVEQMIAMLKEAQARRQPQ